MGAILSANFCVGGDQLQAKVPPKVGGVIGSDRIGSGWVGLGWVGLGWIGLLVGLWPSRLRGFLGRPGELLGHGGTEIGAVAFGAGLQFLQ